MHAVTNAQTQRWAHPCKLIPWHWHDIPAGMNSWETPCTDWPNIQSSSHRSAADNLSDTNDALPHAQVTFNSVSRTTHLGQGPNAGLLLPGTWFVLLEALETVGSKAKLAFTPVKLPLVTLRLWAANRTWCALISWAFFSIKACYHFIQQDDNK